MSRDNNCIGSFMLNGIPPAPAGSESVDVEFDVDANGLLKVQAVSAGSGSKNSITCDAVVHGELSRGEIEDCVSRAELMASLDEKEEMRILARNNFDSYCLKMQLQSTNGDTLNKVDNCLQWIRDNPGATQGTYEMKHKELKKHISGNDNIIKSEAKSREQQYSVQDCHKAANTYFDSKNYIEAFEWFVRLFHIASAKKNETVMKLAIIKIARALKLYSEGDSVVSSRSLDEEKFLIRGAQWLVLGLKLFRVNEKAEDMIEELANIKKVLFEKVAPKKAYFESFEYISQFLSLFNYFDVRRCGEKMRDLMASSFRDFLNTATLYLEHKIDSSVLGSMVHQETLSNLQGLYEPINRLSVIEELQVESTSNDITAEEFLKFVDTNKGVATALNVLCEVNVNFSKTKVDTNIDIEKKIETALYLLDSINDVKKYVKDNLKIFCKLKLIEGKILKVLFSNDEFAKNCFREVNMNFYQLLSLALFLNFGTRPFLLSSSRSRSGPGQGPGQCSSLKQTQN